MYLNAVFNLKLLIDKNANFKEKLESGANLLHIAAFFNDDPNIIKLLVENLKSKNINVNEYAEGVNLHKQTPLHSAARGNKYLIIEYLINELGANKEVEDYKYRRPLAIAAEFSI